MKPPGPGASVPSSNFCFPLVKHRYNPRSLFEGKRLILASRSHGTAHAHGSRHLHPVRYLL
jgi:hypothetical protein